MHVTSNQWWYRGLVGSLVAYVVVSLVGAARLGQIPVRGYRADAESHVTLLRDASPAADAGMRVGDELVRVDGVSYAASRIGRTALAGETLRYDIVRDGEPMQLTLVLGELPASIKLLLATASLIGLGFLASALWVVRAAPSRRTLGLAVAFTGLGWTFANLSTLSTYEAMNAAGAVIRLVSSWGFALLAVFLIDFPLPRPGRVRGGLLLAALVPPSLLIPGTLLVVVSGQPPSARWPSLVSTVAGLHVLGCLAIVLGLLAVRYRRASPVERRELGLSRLIALLLIAIVPTVALLIINTAAPAALPPTASFVLVLLVLMPVALAQAAVQRERSDRGERGTTEATTGLTGSVQPAG